MAAVMAAEVAIMAEAAKAEAAKAEAAPAMAMAPVLAQVAQVGARAGR